MRWFARTWSEKPGAATAEAYVPLYYAPGEAYQFDWSHEVVLIAGVTVTVKVAHVRLCHNRIMFARVYMRDSQEIGFDAHDRAFAFFKGACTRGIYDNMKTAVEAVFTGKERQYNRRLVQMWSHDLVQPPSIGLGPMADKVSLRSGPRGRLFNVVDLVNRLETKTRGGKQGRMADCLTLIDFIILASRGLHENHCRAADESGYLPCAQSGGQLLFHLISRVNERTSIIVNAKLAFGE